MTNTDPLVYKVAFQEMDNPALVTDKNFLIQEVNQAFLEFTGYNRDEVVGETVDILFAEEDVYLELGEELSGNGRWEGNFEATTKAGRTIYGRGSAFSIEDEDGELKAYAGIFTDLTERKRYEDTLKILNRVLRHNLKNDANVILGYITTVRNELSNEEKPQLQEFLSKAEHKINSLINHSDTARDLQTLLATDEDKTIRPMRIDAVVENQVSSARSDYPTTEFSYTSPTEPAVFALVDDSLEQVLTSMLENAVQHNTSDNPQVDVSLEASEDFVTVCIKDNGPGVSEDRKDIIFGREEKDQLHHGQGFSLFFVDNAVQKLNGDVWVENNDDGTGATFHLKLPRPADDDRPGRV